MIANFGHDLVRKYVTLFGTLFNDIYLDRDETDGTLAQRIKVPLSYMEKDKMLARVNGQPDAGSDEDRKVAVVLPRMAFEMNDMTYDTSRKFSKIGRVGRGPDSGQSVFNPTPYNFNFSLYIAVKNSADGTRIIEQILPYFTPDWTVTANLIPGVPSKLDIPVILNGVSKEDTFEGNFKERRSIVWTLTFTLKGYLFGPVSDRVRIETAITNIFNDLVVPPGLAVTITTTEDGVNIEEF